MGGNQSKPPVRFQTARSPAREEDSDEEEERWDERTRTRDAPPPPGSGQEVAGEQDYWATTLAQFGNTSAKVVLLAGLATGWEVGAFVFTKKLLAANFLPPLMGSHTTSNLITIMMLTIPRYTRPVGAIFTGGMSDSLGRDRALKFVLMGSLVNRAIPPLLPATKEFGLASKIVAVVFVQTRLAQGFLTGGETVLRDVILYEAPLQGTRCLAGYTAWMSKAVGLAGCGLTVKLLGMCLTDQQMLTWGWRVPFAMGIIPAAISCWIGQEAHNTEKHERGRRYGQHVFLKVDDISEKRRKLASTAAVVKESWAAVLIGMSVRSCAASLPVTNLYIITRLIDTGMAPSMVAFLPTAALCARMATSVMAGYIGDHYGTSTLLVGLTGFLTFTLYPTFCFLYQPGHNLGRAISYVAMDSVFSLVGGAQGTYTSGMYPIEARSSAQGITHIILPMVYEMGALSLAATTNGPLPIIAYHTYIGSSTFLAVVAGRYSGVARDKGLWVHHIESKHHGPKDYFDIADGKATRAGELKDISSIKSPQVRWMRRNWAGSSGEGIAPTPQGPVAAATRP